MNKKLLALLLVLVMTLSIVTGCGSQGAEAPAEPEETEGVEEPAEGMAEGTYTGSFMGHGGMVTAHVTVDGESITGIEIEPNYETPGLGLVAQEEIVDKILEYQTLEVEAVAGATMTSNAVISSVEQALEEAGADLSAFTDPAKAPPTPEYPSELTADVVIIGGGGAGLAAAVSAVEEGADVIVIEKQGTLGGNTVVCGGIYNAPDPDLQEPEGIEDSPELFMQQTLDAGDNVGNPELVKVLTFNAYDGLEWIESLGAPFKDMIAQGPGSLYPRTHLSEKPLGTGIIDAYIDTLAETPDKCTILMDTKAEHIVLEDGRAVAVKAMNKDDSELTIHANKGIVLATGGFSSNVDLRQKYNTSGKWPDLGPDKPCTNVPGVTGDGIIMAEEIDAALVDMDLIQFLHLCNPEDGSITGILSSDAGGEIFVNKEGKRFVREDGRRDDISLAAQAQTDGIYYCIVSSAIIPDPAESKTLEGVPISVVLENNLYGWVTADTLEELAEKLGMEPEVLVSTVDSYNQAVDAGADEFGRTLFNYKIEDGPFYAYPRQPSIHHTMGGVKINTDAQVLHADDSVIPGLFAAGEVTGGIHGANRIGGNAVVDTVVFGRIAGQNAAHAE